MWKWEDGSTGFFRKDMKLYQHGVSRTRVKPFCAAITTHRNNSKEVTFSECLRRSIGEFRPSVCEIKTKLQHRFSPSSEKRDIQLPGQRSRSFPGDYITCSREGRQVNQSHITHKFLACDGLSDCLVTPDQTGNDLCARDTDPSPPFFVCDNKAQQVPYTLVCDHRHDCADGSDEDFCVFQPCGDPSVSFHCGDGQVSDLVMFTGVH